MSDKDPKTIDAGKNTFESRIKGELVQEAQAWAKETIESDQSWRQDKQINAEREEIYNEFNRLGVDIAKYESFLQSNPISEDEIALKNRLQRFLDKIKEMGSDEENQASLRTLIKKIGGFPSIQEYGKNVAHTAWIVLQHADNDREFQKQGLELMLECRNHNHGVPSVGLTDFYYLADRITIGLYGYQFFGTQNQEAGLIALPKDFKANFEKNPALFCTKLALREYPRELRIKSNDSDLLNLWQLAAQDYTEYGIENLQADANVKKIEDRLKKLS